jgi:hypothetical protein
MTVGLADGESVALDRIRGSYGVDGRREVAASTGRNGRVQLVRFTEKARTSATPRSGRDFPALQCLD